MLLRRLDWHRAVPVTIPKAGHTGRSCMGSAKFLMDIPYTATKPLCWQPWDSPEEQEVQKHQLFLNSDDLHTLWTGKVYTLSCPATLGWVTTLSEQMDKPSFIPGYKELLIFSWLILSRNRMTQEPTQSSKIERQVFQNNHKQGMWKESRTVAFKSSLHLRSASFSP